MTTHYHEYVNGVGGRICINKNCPEKRMVMKPAPSVQGSATSEAAARSLTNEGRQSKKNRIEAALRAAVDGLTDEAGQEITGIPGNTYRVRRGELQEEGKVYPSTKTRLTRSFRAATVYYVR